MTDAPSLPDFETEQYSLARILVIWALVAIPMPILAFFVAPWLAVATELHLALAIWFLMIAGMAWEFAVSLILLRMERLPDWRWSTLKRRLWLTGPRQPRTGKVDFRLFWWLVPVFLAYAALKMTPAESAIGAIILLPFPGLAELPMLDMNELMLPEFTGAWWLVGVAVIHCVFNYFLGEELLFRGVLLPKMRGAFGKWDWVANSVLFGLYHLHKPAQMIGFALSGLVWIWPARRFRSIWFTIVIHGFEGILLIAGVTAVVAGWVGS